MIWPQVKQTETVYNTMKSLLRENNDSALSIFRKHFSPLFLYLAYTTTKKMLMHTDHLQKKKSIIYTFPIKYFFSILPFQITSIKHKKIFSLFSMLSWKTKHAIFLFPGAFFLLLLFARGRVAGAIISPVPFLTLSNGKGTKTIFL